MRFASHSNSLECSPSEDNAKAVCNQSDLPASSHPEIRLISRVLACIWKAFEIAPIKTARLDSRMARSGLSLRTYRLRDLHILYTALERDHNIQTRWGTVDTFGRLIIFRKWLARTFRLLYMMEVPESSCAMRTIGLLGLYRVTVGVSVWLSLAIWDPDDRQRGYGRLALDMILDSIRKNELARTVNVEVLKDNLASLHLLRERGFHLYGYRENHVVLQLCLE